MQQVPDSSTQDLFVSPLSKDSVAKMSTSKKIGKDSIAKADSSIVNKPQQTFSYAQYRRKLAIADSLERVQESARKDSINEVIHSFDSNLSIAYGKISNDEIYYVGNPNREKNTGSVLGILLLCILLIAALWSRYRKRINLLVKSLFNWKLGKQVVRYEQVYSHPVNYILLTVFVVSLSLFVVYVMLPGHASAAVNIGNVLLCSALLVLLYLFKVIVLLFVGNVFRIQEATKEYLFHVLLLLKFCGIVLVPILVLFFYSNVGRVPIIYMAFAVLLLSFLLRIHRAVLIGLQLNERLLPIILYLCTLEILPALVIADFLNKLYFN